MQIEEHRGHCGRPKFVIELIPDDCFFTTMVCYERTVLILKPSYGVKPKPLCCCRMKETRVFISKFGPSDSVPLSPKNLFLSSRFRVCFFKIFLKLNSCVYRGLISSNLSNTRRTLLQELMVLLIVDRLFPQRFSTRRKSLNLAAILEAILLALWLMFQTC